MVRERTQADDGEPVAITNSLTVRSGDEDLAKSVLQARRTKNKYLTYAKCTINSKSR